MNTKRCYGAADILLPDLSKISPTLWSVVACDQFTSEPDYWRRAEELVGSFPSTLNMILPEAYLSEADKRIPNINATMREYLDTMLVEKKSSMIYLERTQSDGRMRKGVVLAVDLEDYDYTRGASSLIRATEATVVERIPPRVAIRREAAIELPHVMLLIDDPEHTVIEPLALVEGETVYDTDLMLGGGHVKGKALTAAEIEKLSCALDALISDEEMTKRYGESGLAPLLFAVGDGNHSLASAKAAYEEIKARIGKEAERHPARYALCEIVNIHDDALSFEPIYRVMFGVDTTDVISSLESYAAALSGKADSQKVTYITAESTGALTFERPTRQLTVGTLQDFIDGYIADHEGVEVDYIHGEASLKVLAQKDNAIGFIFGGMEKSELFKTVIFDGALPRKTFSMGHAEDKRYYLECRRITN